MNIFAVIVDYTYYNLVMLNWCVFRRPGMNGEGGEEAYDGQGPLHLAAQWGQVILTFHLKLLY